MKYSARRHKQQQPRTSCSLVATLFSCMVVWATPSCAESAKLYDNYLVYNDPFTNKEMVASLPGDPINFRITGDLNQFSFYPVFQFFGLLSNAARLTVVQSPTSLDPLENKYSLFVVHDKNVFTNLKNSKTSLTSLGIPSNAVDFLAQRMRDDVKCIVETFPAENRSDLAMTVVLLSEQHNECLVPAVFRSFGVLTGAPSFYAVVSACVLYEGRRAGIRERQALHAEGRRLAERCLEKIGE